MPLRVTNTRTGQRELFEPADPAEVTLYYCGLTVMHISVTPARGSTST